VKIVHVSDGYLPRRGGIEHHVHDLAERQYADGHRVAVITTTPGTFRPGRSFPVIRPFWEPAATPTGGMQHTWVRRALGYVRALDADVVHVHTSTVSPLAFAAISTAAGRDASTVVTMHSMVARGRTVLAALDGLLGWRRQPVAWTAVSSAAARQLADALGGDRPVAVLPNAVDVPAWRTSQRSRDPRRIRIACAGRLSPRKRPRALLHVLQRARQRIDPDVRVELVLAGEGPDRPALQRIVDRHHMADWVDISGARSRGELRETYAQADLYVAPATLESFGLAALEARCAGLPVIAHAGSGVADFVRHDIDGLLVHSDAAMVDAIVGLASDTARHARLLRAAAATVPSLSWGDVLPLTYAAYQHAVKSQAARPARHLVPAP
jgi:glycosyltransferase involved in cell wall biosynthesis